MKTNLEVENDPKFAPEESLNDRETILKINKSLSDMQNFQKSQPNIEENKTPLDQEFENYVIEKEKPKKHKHAKHPSLNKIINENLVQEAEDNRWNTLIQRDPDFDEYNDIVNENLNDKIENMPISVDYKNNSKKDPKKASLHLKQGELIDPRSGSPIVPALRNKLIQSSQTVQLNNNEGVVIDNRIPKRSITEIGQEAKDNHERNKSVTDLGKDHIPEIINEQLMQDHSRNPSITQEKNIGKPPLSQNSAGKLKKNIEFKL